MTSQKLVALLFVCAATTFAQTGPARPWQSLQMPMAAKVKSTWQSPPPEYGPEPYYGLGGPVTLDVARRDLDTMRKLGFRAVTVQYGSGAPFAYLSPQYFAFFRQFVMEVKKRNMRIWIVDDAGYPSGFAGGKFTAERPELRMQALEASKTAVAGGSTFDQEVPADTVAVTAIDSGSGNTEQIPIHAGRTHWTAPSGNWTVYAVEHAFRTSPTRSETNPTHKKDATQSLEDYLDPAATAQYIQFTHEAYKKAVGDEFGKTILGFRGDEPDYSIRGLPWTPRFFQRFRQVKGYDIRPYLAVFLQGRDAVLTPTQLRARADYYDVFADLFRDGFFKPLGEWCAANGLEYQVHLNHEERQLELAHSEGDFFRDMRYVQVPGIDAIWHQIWTDTVSDFPRLASSAAHVYGHPRAFTESFAAYRPAPDLTMARYILNEQFVRGINLVEAMYFPASSRPGHGGPSGLMRDPGYPALMRYTGWLSYLMSMGHPAAQVALLLPAEALWMGEAKANDTFVSTERALSEHQIDFDIVGEDAIDSVLKMEPGAFVSRSGNRYRTVLVPQTTLLPEFVLKRLRSFAKQGGHVLFIGAAPTHIAGRTDLHARQVSADDFSWATVVPVELAATPTPPAQPPPSAPAPLAVPAELLQALKTAGPRSDLTLDQPNTALRFTERKLKDASVFLLFNESDRSLNDLLTLRAPGRILEVWNPETGEAKRISDTKFANGQVKLPLSLAAYTTRVFVVR